MSDNGVIVPAWVAVGNRARWWSQSQQKIMGVSITKVDEKNKIVIATFEADKTVWKSVPFSKLAAPDCPLQKVEEQRAKASKDAKENGAAEQREGSRTPDWWEHEKNKMKKRPSPEEIKRQEKNRRSEEAKLQRVLEVQLEEKRRAQLLVEEKRKVQEAFEKRKKEAETQKMKEEEEWRKNLRNKRLKEAAEEEEREKDKDEKRRKKKEEKSKARAEQEEKTQRQREAREAEERKRKDAEVMRTQQAMEEFKKNARLQAAAQDMQAITENAAAMASLGFIGTPAMGVGIPVAALAAATGWGIQAHQAAEAAALGGGAWAGTDALLRALDEATHHTGDAAAAAVGALGVGQAVQGQGSSLHLGPLPVGQRATLPAPLPVGHRGQAPFPMGPLGPLAGVGGGGGWPPNGWGTTGWSGW